MTAATRKQNNMNDIVIGIDRSETAAKALRKAAEIASAQQADLHIVMCVDKKAPVDFHVGSDHFHCDALSEARQFLDEAAQHTGVPTTSAVGVGDPAEFLCEEASRLRARVIVVGNRRVQTMARVLGTVASDVIKHAPCDVLIANTCNEPTKQSHASTPLGIATGPAGHHQPDTIGQDQYPRQE